MDKAAVKIIHITDLHIPPEDAVIDGIDARKNVIKIFNKIKKLNFDFLIISGDISLKRGEIECYEWLKKLLDEFYFKFFLIPGNHDNITNMSKIFKLDSLIKNGELYYTFDAGNWKLLLLDTSKDRISSTQLDWVACEALKSEKQLIIFMHHPPATCGCRFMDQHYPLKNIEDFQNKTRKIENIGHIFCGHFHTSKKISAFGKKIYITPSCLAQINEKAEDLKISSYKIGYRQIVISQKKINTNVVFIN